MKIVFPLLRGAAFAPITKTITAKGEWKLLLIAGDITACNKGVHI
jgi:hypothetical protein